LAGKPVDKSRWSIGSRVLGCATYVAVSCQNKDNVFPAVPNFLEALEVIRSLDKYGFLIWEVDKPSTLYWLACSPEYMAHLKKKKDLNIEPFELARLIPDGTHVRINGPPGSGKRTLKKYFCDNVLKISGKAYQGDMLIDEYSVLGPWFIAVSSRTTNRYSDVPRFDEAIATLHDIFPYSFLVWNTTDPTKLYYVVADAPPPVETELLIEPFDIASELGLTRGVSIYGPPASGKKTLKAHLMKSALKGYSGHITTTGDIYAPSFIAMSCRERGVYPAIPPRFREALDKAAAIDPYSFLIWKEDSSKARKLYYVVADKPPVGLVTTESFVPIKITHVAAADPLPTKPEIHIERFDPQELVRSGKWLEVRGPPRSGKTTLVESYKRRIGDTFGTCVTDVPSSRPYRYIALSCRAPEAFPDKADKSIKDAMASTHPYGFLIWDIYNLSKFYWD
ncbi:MAG: hypothetical protein P4L51_07740, partial [Puia sp.]|nr:hypothetical protein [Puia sp.]